MSQIRWSPAPGNVVKANLDASIWEEGKATAAYIVRDEAGRLLLAAGCLCEFMVIEEVELRAVWGAIRLLRIHCPWHSTWLEGDTVNVIRRLHVSNSYVDSSTLMADARELLRSMEISRLHIRIGKEINMLAS